jgi:hypothetical protein
MNNDDFLHDAAKEWLIKGVGEARMELNAKGMNVPLPISSFMNGNGD